MKIQIVLILLLLTWKVYIGRSQHVIAVNKNLELTVKVVSINSKHYIIPNLKVFSDTQEIEIPKEIYYANENVPIADCRFSIGKLIENQIVNMYVDRLVNPNLDNKLRKFTSKDFLSDTICIEGFIPLETGHYIVTLEFVYYRNGVKNVINSNKTSFFIKPK